jgi:hypothetical protein
MKEKDIKGLTARGVFLVMQPHIAELEAENKKAFETSYSLMEENRHLRALEANSVPFVVMCEAMQKDCDSVQKQCYWCGAKKTKQTCPLIPKGE